jgi:hypothetical protein
MQYRILLSFLLIYAVDGQAQKVCRQNYKNEASLSYNNLMSFVFGAAGLSYERTIYHKKNKDNFVSIQLEYTSMIDPYNNIYIIDDRVAFRTLSPSLKYNFGSRHIYSLGIGAVFSYLNTTPACSLNYKYDLNKYKFTIGGGLQVSYLGLAKTKEQYNPLPPIIVTGSLSPYSYHYSWKDRILFNVRIGKYF